MDASYWEFHKDTAHYVATAEKLVTPYVRTDRLPHLLSYKSIGTSSEYTMCLSSLHRSPMAAWSVISPRRKVLLSLNVTVGERMPHIPDPEYVDCLSLVSHLFLLRY